MIEPTAPTSPADPPTVRPVPFPDLLGLQEELLRRGPRPRPADPLDGLTEATTHPLAVPSSRRGCRFWLRRR